MNTPEDNERPTCRLCSKKALKGRTICYAHFEARRSPNYTKEYRAANRALLLQKRVEYKKQCKAKVIEMYGGKCECCGELNHAFLNIDHINNDGEEKRKAINGQNVIFVYLSTKPVDFENYRLMCFNCNCARRFQPDKLCPHQIEQDGCYD